MRLAGRADSCSPPSTSDFRHRCGTRPAPVATDQWSVSIQRVTSSMYGDAGGAMQPGDNEPAQSETVDSTGSTWWAPWPVVALIVVTVANYVWQVPYYEHFYGRFGRAPAGLTVPLVLTFVWFLLGAALLITRRRGGRIVLASFLVVEVLFYLVHNLTGAAGRDLMTTDVVLFVASLLGYLNTAVAIVFLFWLRRTRR